MVGGGWRIKREASLPRRLRKCLVSTCYVQKPDLGGGQAPPLSGAGDLCGWGGHCDILACALLLRQCLRLIHFSKICPWNPLLHPYPAWGSSLCVVSVGSCGSQLGSFHFILPP